MKLEYRNGLLFTDIELIVNDNRKVINNIVVDTGAAQTVISQECVDDIGIRFTGKEEIVTTYGIGGEEHAFVKEVDEIVIEDFKLKNYNIDFTGFIYEGINGLLGLDILMNGGFIIDLKDLAIKMQ